MSTPDLAVVTGAARGIGRAIAERLAADGYRLALIDVLPEIEAVAAALPGASAAIVDVRDGDAVRRLFARAAGAARFAVLVNCAGTCARTGFEDTLLEEWRRDVDTNLTGAFFASQAAVFPYMRDGRYGRIVNVASVSGKVGGVGPAGIDVKGDGRRSGAAYAASKAGLINLTRWIAREVGRWNITCNAVAPGPILTTMTAGREGSYPLDGLPVPRFGRPAEVAEAVAYLVHPDRGYTTGVCLHVDGGMVLA